ncbi:pimeloyl-ACP methyl ester carboxylesterase [Roseinatronobacter thiooxidans]|uniref:Pimeloyl-ACP methyl ester carboxylesterase n=1 Tax=Roseinatronobacter thiooxidans TaxID=121821 RepID=A0A2W7QZM3_9RHOB|nr:alpha/beta fold hydrolase [Roseinatronobacter thiooxidans]PZX47289.1 pimeloyl-ACP methyl ester carboxylesterase [Roseinatronobacter thiooxidans]
MLLNQVRHGTPTELPALLIVHGLFGSARNWGAIAKRLSDSREVICVDMRNHGDSPWADAHGYEDLAADLAGVVAQEGGRLDVLGHSMGGKAAMMLALLQPDMVNRLLVADIAPVAYAHSQSHLIQAMRGMNVSEIDSRAAADAELAREVETASVRAFLLQSLDLRADPARWRLNLDVLEREMDRITGWPEVAAQFGGPALFLSGALSDYVLAEHRPAIKALFPNAKFAKLPDAGHWLHAEAPRPFEATARMWFE